MLKLKRSGCGTVFGAEDHDMADEEMKGIPDEIKEEMEDDWSGDDGSGEDDASGTIEGNEDDGDEEEEEEEDDAEEDGETGPSRVYLPGDADDAEKAGDLVCDESAYAMYHTCGTSKVVFRAGKKLWVTFKTSSVQCCLA